MYPRAFEYLVPDSIEDAIRMLSSCGEEAKLLAGGQSLIPLMKLRLASPRWLIDIGRLGGLAYVREDETCLRIGALTPHTSVVESQLVQQRFPLVADAVSVIGDSQVRNWGTIGGALAEADPAGDWGPVALALKARVRCVSPRGERILDADSFFVDAYTTRLDHDELITEVIFPTPAPDQYGAYVKLERRAGDFAVVSVGVQLAMDERKVCRDACIALGAAGLTPIQAPDAASFLTGKEIRPDNVQEAARRVARAAEPIEDIRGSQDYKRAALQSIFKQAVAVALRRSQGETIRAGHG
ncbi:MAG TPA: xanthine dehydrogenase family protein subunit M [Candidatus Binatia bacterium]|nr:xanthine dehydrogenase family protein subunit M [Candidatus Binatia bacterium]